VRLHLPFGLSELHLWTQPAALARQRAPRGIRCTRATMSHSRLQRAGDRICGYSSASVEGAHHV
jgi:hypothetical protein